MIVCGPAGTRRSVYLPSAAVTVLWPVAWTVTDTLLSAAVSPLRVTVPVTVPVSWAAAMAGGTSAPKSAQQDVRSVDNTADEARRIPMVLVGWVVRMRLRQRRRAGIACESE